MAEPETTREQTDFSPSCSIRYLVSPRKNLKLSSLGGRGGGIDLGPGWRVEVSTAAFHAIVIVSRRFERNKNVSSPYTRKT